MTGEMPWSSWSTLETKKMVKKGVIPFIPEEFREPGSLDMVLTNLTERAYTNDPKDRISRENKILAAYVPKNQTRENAGRKDTGVLAQ
jgi:hypothetical protein